jgi:hypothetical protein
VIACAGEGLDCLVRQGHDVGDPHLHALGRDPPFSGLKVELGPLGRAQLAGAHEREGPGRLRTLAEGSLGLGLPNYCHNSLIFRITHN